MGELAYFSTVNQDILYKEFGVDAELLIDHAWGLEPCGMKEIKAYKPMGQKFSFLYKYLAFIAHIVVKYSQFQHPMDSIDSPHLLTSANMISWRTSFIPSLIPQGKN